jgi:Ser/Thr protein kinase RdoA (MazF antagonist)
MIGWLEGTSLHDADTEIYQRLGAEMAKLHCACDAWSPPAEFVRCDWDADGLLGEAPVWGRFWENPTLDTDTRALFEHFRLRAQAELDAAECGLDYGLIHADILQENVLIDGPDVRLLDFDDGGFGFRLFDLATTLLRCVDAPNFPELKDALLHGYEAERAINTEHLNLFLALRAMTYVGWIVPRMSEDGAQERNQRFVARAKKQAMQYLNCGFP